MKAIGLVALLVVLALAGVGRGYPALAAAACPSCLGFQEIGDRVYVEKNLSDPQKADALGVVGAAREKLRAFYNAPISHPEIFICDDDPCYRTVGGGGSRGMAILTFALFLSPRGGTDVIAAHEMSHIELHNRIGLAKTFRRTVPQWFDEGLAVFVSDDRRYLKPADEGDRCLIEPDGPMPTTRTAWVESVATHDLYAKAACRVSRWIAKHGGSVSALHLLQAVARGDDFATAYGEDGRPGG